MIKFGPSGNSEIFYAQGYKHTYEAMKWIADMGLNAYEYSFGRGVRLGEQTAEKIKNEAEKYGVSISVHAPYFINLANSETDKNAEYFIESGVAAKWLGAKRIVFHPGSCAKIDRKIAFEAVKTNLKEMINRIDESGLSDLTYCPETMGKINQIGDLSEIIELCNIDERLLPTIDFGHLHTRGIGCINSSEDFAAILDALINGIGYERTRDMHVHFSKIEFTKAGEKRHVTFADEGFGPDFNFLAPELVKRRLEPTIICESKGTMAEDAKTMLEIYNSVKESV